MPGRERLSIADGVSYGKNWNVYVCVTFSSLYRTYYWCNQRNDISWVTYANPRNQLAGLDAIAAKDNRTEWYDQVWSMKFATGDFYTLRKNHMVFFGEDFNGSLKLTLSVLKARLACAI